MGSKEEIVETERTIRIIQEDIQNLIYNIRGVQVMLDSDLARLYGVEVKRLNQQVKRNSNRFPESFMFQLSKEEYDSLRSQNATLENGDTIRSQYATIKNSRGKHRKYLSYAFTEQGVAMLSAVLRRASMVSGHPSRTWARSGLPFPRWILGRYGFLRSWRSWDVGSDVPIGKKCSISVLRSRK